LIVFSFCILSVIAVCSLLLIVGKAKVKKEGDSLSVNTETITLTGKVQYTYNNSPATPAAGVTVTMVKTLTDVTPNQTTTQQTTTDGGGNYSFTVERYRSMSAQFTATSSEIIDGESLPSASAGYSGYTLTDSTVIASIKDALNKMTSFIYDSRGQLQTMTNPRNFVTTLVWDTQGRLSQPLDALNNQTTYSYDSRARLTSATNALNQTTTYEYDSANRLKKIIFPDTKFVEFTYDLAGRTTKVKDARGNETNYVYDSAYRLMSVTDALNHTTTYNYDLMSNQTSTTNALSQTINHEYDEFNRLKKIIYHPAISGGTRLEESLEYDLVGNVRKRIDTAGRQTVYDYDNANRLIKITDAANQITQLEYNSRSQLTKVTDALSRQYVFVYDPLGRLLTQTKSGVVETFEYDSVGNKTKRTNYNGFVTNYVYDGLNRLTTINYQNSLPTGGTVETVRYGYDVLSRLTTATNYTGTVSFSYDNRGRLQSETDVFGRIVSYTFDENGNRTALKLDGTTQESYSYDAANRLTQITDSANGNYIFGYDVADKLISRTLPNGVSTIYDYDGLSRLTRLKHTNGAGVLNDFQYSYNTANQITQITEPAKTRSFNYDSVDRITSAVTTNQPSENYVYDSVGNRTSSHLSSTYAYQQGAFNRLTSTSTTNYTFDNNGNMTSKSDASNRWYFYNDGENRLVRATKAGIGSTLNRSVHYQYDALGRRVVRQDKKTGRTEFTHDGMDVLQDRNLYGDATTTTNYVNGLGTDNKLKQSNGSSSSYFLTDHLGSTITLTDTNGIATSSAAYDSFGNATSSLPTRYGYTGRETDDYTGLMFYRARFYDPQTGRFINEDPIGLSGGINSYSYASNNPINKTDPSGLYELDVHYYLTYFLAMKTGCFSEKYARDIAEGNQGTDENPKYSPGARKAFQNDMYHALHPGGHDWHLNFHWQNAINKGKGNAEQMGRYLHYMQDTYSHDGFTNRDWGHSPVSLLEGDAPGTHIHDKTSWDVEKAMRMARATWDVLMKYAKELGCKCDPNAPFDAIADQVRKFSEARSGVGWVENLFSIDEAPTFTWGYLQNKRRILNVPLRVQ